MNATKGDSVLGAVSQRPVWERIEWLLEDMKQDDLMAGVPRYQPRYTSREQEVGDLLRWAVEEPRSEHVEHVDPLHWGYCAVCGTVGSS